MYIVEVIPFVKTLRKESLSYFSKDPIDPGQIVTISLRNREVFGLVLTCKDGSSMKGEIKASDFALRKIKKIHKQTLFKKQFVKTASRIAEYFATSTGSVIETLTPSKIFEEINSLPKVEEKSEHVRASKGEKFIIQETDDDRYSHYKALIREEFAKKRSVLFICPTVEDSLRSSQLLSKGIEDATYVFHGKLTKKQLVAEWKDAIKNERPVLIICTGMFIGIPRHDIGSIIVEKENTSSYSRLRSPYIDIRLCAEYYAEEIGARFFMGDLMLRSETIYRYNNHEVYERTPLQFRSLSASSQLVVNMSSTKTMKKSEFQVLSSELIDAIITTKEENHQMFIYTLRKGLAPSVVCQDCNTVMTCPNCSKSLVLYGKDATKEGNLLRCHGCGYHTSAGCVCKSCNSWRLQTLGIGTELVAKEVENYIPKESIFVLDSEQAKTPKQARMIIDAFYNKPGSVLIGTEMALLYLHEPVAYTAVSSLDSLFTIPEFHIKEKILSTLLKIRSKTSIMSLVQTRRADEDVFKYVKNGNIAEFYREELKERKEFGFPPYFTIIKITLAGEKGSVTKSMKDLEEIFKPFEFHTYQAFAEKIKNKYIMNGIIKIQRDKWIDKDLLRKLQSLPPQYRIIVGTESLL